MRTIALRRGAVGVLLLVVLVGCDKLRPTATQLDQIDKAVGIASLTLAESYDSLASLLQAKTITVADARSVLSVLNQVDVALRGARHYLNLGDVTGAQASLDRANGYLMTAGNLTAALRATPIPGGP